VEILSTAPVRAVADASNSGAAAYPARICARGAVAFTTAEAFACSQHARVCILRGCSGRWPPPPPSRRRACTCSLRGLNAPSYVEHPHIPSFRTARSPSRAPLTGSIAPTPAGSDVPVSTAATPSAELAFLWLGAGSGGSTSCADAHAAGSGCCLVGRSCMDIGRKWWYVRPRASARPWWAA
jgi:hypothetical protein